MWCLGALWLAHVEYSLENKKCNNVKKKCILFNTTAMDYKPAGGKVLAIAEENLKYDE